MVQTRQNWLYSYKCVQYKVNNFTAFFLSIMSYLKVQPYIDLHTYTFIFLDINNTVSCFENLECLNMLFLYELECGLLWQKMVVPQNWGERLVIYTPVNSSMKCREQLLIYTPVNSSMKCKQGGSKHPHCP